MAISEETFFLDPAFEGTLQKQIQSMVAEGILSDQDLPESTQRDYRESLIDDDQIADSLRKLEEGDENALVTVLLQVDGGLGSVLEVVGAPGYRDEEAREVVAAHAEKLGIDPRFLDDITLNPNDAPVVVRDVASRDILPVNEEAKLIWSIKATAKWDISESFAVVGNVNQPPQSFTLSAATSRLSAPVRKQGDPLPWLPFRRPGQRSWTSAGRARRDAPAGGRP